MAIVKMKKVFLIGLEEEKASILKALQEMGNVEIQEITDLSEDDQAVVQITEATAAGADLEQKLLQVKFTLNFLGRYNKVKKSMFAGKQTVAASGLSEVMDRQLELLDVADQCRIVEEEQALLRSRRARLSNTIGQVLPWQTLDIPLDAILDTVKTRVLIGSVGKDRAGTLQKQMDESDEEIFLHLVSTGKEDAYFLVIYHKDCDSVISDRLKEAGFNRVSFPELKGTSRQIIYQCEKDIKAIDDMELQIAKSTKELLSNINELEILYDGLNIELEKYRATDRILHTGKAYLLKGWLQSSDQKQLMDRLLSITDAIQIEFEDPVEDETFPVVLENKGLVQPFELVTNLYSTPHSRGIDPNPYMAPFFFTFFGMMMGDAGYGLLMIFLAAFFIWKLKPKGMAKKMGWLVCLGGIGTFIWGVLSGSWFGDFGEIIAKGLGFGSVVVWFNPMDEPVLMLEICFGLGLIHVFTGMGIKAYMSIRDGRIWDAIFDQGLWYVLIIGLILLATPVSQVGKMMAIAGAVGLVLTQGREKKGIIKKFTSGLLSLYNVTSILSDILSYSRLFALGLATGVIAMVINLLVIMLGTTWYGFIIAIIIFIGGHAFNIAINLLGSFVHAARLQYIEFFGKFFEGGGHTFTPLTIKTKYIDLI